MRKSAYFLLAALVCFALPWNARAEQTKNPAALTGLLNRIGQEGAAERFVTVVDDALSTGGKETFVITSEGGKPCIKGSTVLAAATGINWYLNHYANINLAWNNLTTDLTTATLPVPGGEETHTCSADYRYYLNYCTFSYSMSTWTWERWQQEIDWMALHGINMPLQIIGLDVLWRNLLVEDLGYTKDEANKFIAGPCFQAWWGMNNLEGWGGPNPDWWYERQEQLCKQVLSRQRELGMQPVLPGYSGMVPSDITAKTGYKANNQGGWCGFVRPYILDPNSEAFATVSAQYYEQLEKLMGTSKYYSMDPFHEGANTSGIDVASAYKKIGNAMTKAKADAQWVIQFWQWNGDQYNVLSQVEKGKLIVLDLYSDAHTHFGDYRGHDAVYCILPNFGGRTGFFGRLSKVMKEYFNEKSRHANVKGIGATPEAIEQVPILYDALFELPWRTSAPDPAKWTKEYATARYGTENANAIEAWEKLRTSSLDCPTALQGPMEAVLCARPSLNVGAVSSWGGTEIFYDAQEVARAAHLLLEAKLSGENYSYDLTDISRQALTDYGYYLLKAINAANNAGDKEAYRLRRDKYLQLILDLDELLNTNANFMLGRWTQMARGIADEVAGTTEADKDWLELYNARTIISTWGDRVNSENGGLRDYSYREWGGMMKDYYYPRWKKFFDNRETGTPNPDWFTVERAWALNANLSYSDQPTGNTAEVAGRLFAKYFVDFANNGTHYYIYRGFANDLASQVSAQAYRGESFTCPIASLPADVTARLGIDTNNDGMIADTEKFDGITVTIPATSATGKVKAILELADGTSVAFSLALADHITEPRTVSVASADEKQGRATIEGTKETSVTNTENVTIKAIPVSGYDFVRWTDSKGNAVSTANPYTYYGKEAETFTAHFIVNKWGTPAEDKSEWGTIDSYGQYVTEMTMTQNGQDPVTVYSASSCPEHLFQTTQIVNAPAGSQFKLAWKDAGTNGLGYCRLSAYIDLNSDGDFNDAGEFLAVMGNKSGTNNELQNASLAILLPYDIPQGVTHVRLRFDGAWQLDNINPATDATRPDAKMMRMVYDVPVNVTAQSAQACTITVKTSDKKAGTVDANGQPDTYTYSAGEPVVLRCYPAEGYEIHHWTDKYNRAVPTEWMDGNFLRFVAPESGTYTAHFSSIKTLAVGNWNLIFEEEENGASIIGVQSGKGELDLSAENSEKKEIVRISPDALKGNTELTELTLPATLTSLDRFFTTNFTGAGETNALITPARTISGKQPWTLVLEGSNSGASFNDWGSGLLATGSDALGNSYDGGFQFYLKKAGTLIVKVGSSEQGFSPDLNGEFSVKADYDGTEKLTVTVSNAAGKTETKVLTQKLNAITNFSTAIPAGVNITKIYVDDHRLGNKPFDGCSALRRVYVEQGNPYFSDKEGKLYDAAGKTLLLSPAAYDATGISSLQPAEGDSKSYYDLQGRPAPSPTRGVYIDNQRRKVIFK